MIDKNKVLFSTSEGLMKMVLFKAEVFKDTVVYDKHQYNTQSKIKGFQVLDENAKNIISVDVFFASLICHIKYNVLSYMLLLLLIIAHPSIPYLVIPSPSLSG